jgi:hypothetical protein
MTNNYEKIRQVLATPVTGKRKKPTLNDLPRELRGLSNNKYGGHQRQKMRPFKNSTFGPASKVKQFTPEERANCEKGWKAREKETS